MQEVLAKFRELNILRKSPDHLRSFRPYATIASCTLMWFESAGDE